MTINAQQLPVAAIERIVVVVMILMMNGQFIEILGSKFPRTPAANPGVHLERPFPVSIFFKLLIALDLTDKLLHFIFIEGCLFHGHDEKFSDAVLFKRKRNYCVQTTVFC